MVPNHWILTRLDAVTLKATESHKDPTTATTQEVILHCWMLFDISKDKDTATKSLLCYKKQVFPCVDVRVPTESVWHSLL